MRFLVRSFLILLALYGLVFAIGDLYLARVGIPVWGAIAFAVVFIGFQFLIGPWLIESVAGVIDPGESAEETVRREAVEEAGTAISDIVPITTYLTSPGACSEVATLFCGRVDASGAGGIHGVGHEEEDIRVVRLSAAEAFARRRKNEEIQDSITVNALLWLELEREDLRRRWR